MALPGVSITLGPSALGGAVQSDDSIAALVTTGATEGTHTAGTPVLIYGLAGLQALGVTATNNALLLKDVKEFYDEAPAGSPLYLMAVPSTMTLTQMCDITNANGLVKLLDYAQGKARIVAVNATPAGSPTITAGLNGDVATALVKLQATATSYATAQKPFRGIIAGLNFSGTAADLTDLNTAAYNRCSVFIGDTASGNGAAVGLLLGRLAKLPVQRKASRVKDGPVNLTAAYVGSATTAAFTGTTTVHDKAYITLRTIPNRTGVFFTSDKTATSSTDDYSLISRGRVVDKAQVIAYQVYTDEVDDEVPTEAGGVIDAGYARGLEQNMENQVRVKMLAKSEASGFTAQVDRASNVQQTGTVNISLLIRPLAYASNIAVKLAFTL